MPRGMKNPENMPRGICHACGAPTEAIWKERITHRIAYVCVPCQKPADECDCQKVTPVYCKDCGELTGHENKQRGWFFGPKGGHVCKK
jgi:hypothetical protein